MTPQDLKDRLLRPLRRELATGAEDKVVAGGLEKLLENLGQPFPEVQAALRGYRQLTPSERVERLHQAIQLLDGTPRPSGSGENPQPSPSPRGLEAGNLNFDSPVEGLSLGPGAKKKLNELGIRSVRDLLHTYPRRYEDRRTLQSLREVEEGQKATVFGKVLSRELVKTPKRGIQLVQVRLMDAWGWKFTAVWFNQPWVLKQIAEGASLVISGRVQRRGANLSIMVEYFEDEAGESLSTGRIVPVYPAKEGVGQAFLRRAAWRGLEAFSQIPDPLEPYRQEGALAHVSGLPSLDFALRQAHFPSAEEALEQALYRLKFDEFLLLELKVMLQSGNSALLGRTFRVTPEMVERFRAALPFTLTEAQERVLNEVLSDMQGERQMARLVQGDVGSGKTAVAAAALYIAACNNAQGALMAPTEILAKQHFANLTHYLYPLGVSLDLLVGSMSAAEKRGVYDRLKAGQTHVVVGTHALIQEQVEFRDLGLAIIDEEHRFGVMQRRALLGSRPDLIVMSATPIPRSLALTLYGDLEVSQIDQLPPGRIPVKTKVLPHKLRSQAYAFAQGEIAKGRQVFVVTPMIEESEAEGMEELAAATKLRNELTTLLPEVRIDLLHGKMPAAEKDAVMERFKAGQFDLLVSTTVIEVGVDIPQATLMIIENAERFGLAQLHQLRGRVGRGGLEAYCILIAGESSKKTLHRLRVIEESNDGFYIAEKDLELRGPGELRGVRQSGMPDLRIGDLVSDQEIIERARAFAQAILEADPYLDAPQNALLKREIQARAEAIGFREVI
ncbi:ATP-dependent DNA helicase RecG [Meiothermus granaticius]|uniref:ATP-dependent DNA helicase RecG n=1 Tax=Meiothermus granaticius NBRC 107808 TaxID=1227551 RepID=A0A399F4Z4_9DEIN|nr:ATP-dependent DNA helicase RecG [Meiothermus granaticius]RIH91837.1 ATP-dependent DNA helicase RecG [Meiothermus granaticius NBRC 107808]GEM85650.1 ATP-dependent DNA helicase RecG [Meiothermus granaticius NBRC 107808]